MRLGIAFAVALSIAGCAPAQTRPPAASSPLQAVLVASELPVGEQRVPVGILERNSPVTDATVHVRAYRGSATDPSLVESAAPFKGEGLRGQGVYVARLRFAAAGVWTIEVQARRSSGASGTTLIPVNILARASVPWIGDPAPRSRNPTRHDVADVAEIDSGSPPDDMHELSIADTIAQRRAALVVFATPAFCTSAMCGPEVDAVKALEPVFHDRLVFIHVEIYTDFRSEPSRRHLAPTVLEWRLRTEPWVFLIDREGVIQAVFEGPAATDELRAAAEAVLSRL